MSHALCDDQAYLVVVYTFVIVYSVLYTNCLFSVTVFSLILGIIFSILRKRIIKIDHTRRLDSLKLSHLSFKF